MIEFRQMNQLPVAPASTPEGSPAAGDAFEEMLARSLGRQPVGRFAENQDRGADNGETRSGGGPSAWHAAAILTELAAAAAAAPVAGDSDPYVIDDLETDLGAVSVAPPAIDEPDASQGHIQARQLPGTPPPGASTTAGFPVPGVPVSGLAANLAPAPEAASDAAKPAAQNPFSTPAGQTLPPVRPLDNPWTTVLGTVADQTRAMAAARTGETDVGGSAEAPGTADLGSPGESKAPPSASVAAAPAAVTSASIAADAAARARVGLSPLRAALASVASDGEPMEAPVAVGGGRSPRPHPSRFGSQIPSPVSSTAPVPAAGIAETAPAPAPGRVDHAPTPASIINRVIRVVEMQQHLPPPRSMVVEIPELDGLQLTVSLRGTEVHIVTADRAQGAALFRPFQNEVAAALDARGLDLWLQSGDQSSERRAWDEPEQAPTPDRIPFRRRSRREAPTGLRL